MAKNFKKTELLKSIRSYDDSCDSQIIAYAVVERCSWEVKSGKSNYTFLHLDILCPDDKEEEFYQEINYDRDFCLRKEIIGCIKNFTYNSKTFDANYDHTEIVKRYNNTYLRFSLCIAEELTLTDDELLEKIENSYNKVAEVLVDEYRIYLREEFKNKKLELFDKLIDKEDIKQIEDRYYEIKKQLNDNLAIFYDKLLNNSDSEIIELRGV